MTFNRAPVTALPVSPEQRDVGGHYRIRVIDLVLPATIGIYDHEKLGPQRVRINVDLKVAQHGGRHDDDIAKVLSYEDIVNGIKAIIAGGHINLVETLAERVVDLCLADSRVMAARVGVDKLDVVPEAASVGVEIERTR
jgi:dihydroneopterin aldolase